VEFCKSSDYKSARLPHRCRLKVIIILNELITGIADWSVIPRPTTKDERLLVMSASLAELLASRQKQAPPAWTNEIGALQEPFFLLQSTAEMKRLRILCGTQSPEPKRKRRLYAPPNFLEFA
jgi:hypothetical protein